MIRLRAVRRRDPAAAFDAAEQARARLLLDLATGEDGLRLPRPLAAAEVRSGLPRGVALVEYAVLPDRLLAWVVTRDDLDMVETPVAGPDLARAVRALRTAVERNAGEREVRLASAPLFDLLLRPLLPHLPDGAPLVVVPDRFLVHVPFPALFDSARNRYLLEDRLLGTAPSASFYLASRAALRRFSPQDAWTVLALGDPAFDTRLHPQVRLPEAAAEVMDLEALYPGAHVLRDAAATRAAFLETAGRYRLIHYAGHAIADPAAPHLSRLLLAPGPGKPPGDLTAQEIAALRLDATELVVLSACRTLTGGTGRESLTGLAAAFLAAGPPVVVSSLWNAEDRATRELMRTFHHALRQGQPPGPALRTAQLELLHHPDETLRSPSAWAGFAAVGGGVG
jgi:CHAT domain-containing protein